MQQSGSDRTAGTDENVRTISHIIFDILVNPISIGGGGGEILRTT